MNNIKIFRKLAENLIKMKAAMQLSGLTEIEAIYLKKQNKYKTDEKNYYDSNFGGGCGFL